MFTKLRYNVMQRKYMVLLTYFQTVQMHHVTTSSYIHFGQNLRHILTRDEKMTSLPIETLLNTRKPYLTDGGLETTLIFHDGVELPHFASFTQLDSPEGRVRVDSYFDDYLEAASDAETGFVIDTPTWRANAAWGDVMGLGRSRIAAINTNAVAMAKTVRDRWQCRVSQIIINGAIGPAGDGYAIEQSLESQRAKTSHAVQIEALAAAGVDMVTALTMTHTGEAIGIVQAAKDAGVPVAIGFTVETDGKLPSGQSLGDAIAEVDAVTTNEPIYYMINCAHPDHFKDALLKGENWLKRIGSIRANASRMSHAELDVAEKLDPGNPQELANDYQVLQSLLPNLKVLGGCCGTDHRHVHAIGHACVHKHAA